MKKAILALMLVCMMLLSGCALIKQDEAVLNKKVVLSVDDTTFTRAEVGSQLENELYQMAYMYSMFGYSYDPTDAAIRAETLETVLTNLTESAVTDAKAKELGMYEFTDEEKATIAENAQADYDSYIESYVSYYTDETKTEEELKAEAEEYMVANGINMEELTKSNEYSMSQDKLRNSIIEGIAPTEDDVQTLFDEKVASAKTNYESNLSSYGNAKNNGTTVYYTPAGYRIVKQILIKYNQEDLDAITALQNEITAATDVDTLTALNEKLEAAENAAAEAIADKVAEVTAKIDAGEDFDALVAQYNEDTGMPEIGYYLCDGYAYFVESFTNAGMALEAIGDVSEPTKSNYGLHILKYEADVEEGPVDIAEVHDTLYNSALTEAQDEAYEAQVAEWVGAAKVVRDDKYMPQ